MSEQEKFIEKIYSEEFMKELQNELEGFDLSFRSVGRNGEVFTAKVEWEQRSPLAS